MTNLEKYNQAFVESFSVEAIALNDDFVYQSLPAWDSVGHMGLMAALEEAFDVMLETDDIVDFSSYEHGKTILRKYDIAL